MRLAHVSFVLLVATLATAHADVAVGASVDVQVGVPPPPAPPPPPAVVIAAPPPALPPPGVVGEAPHPMVAQDRSHPATLGLELTAINGRVFGWGASAGTGIAVVIHPLDSYPLDVSIDYRRDVFLDDPDARVDHRINYSLYVGPQAPALAPYVVFPMGIDIVTRAEMATVLEGFLGIGAGGRWRVTDHLTVRGDARIETRGQATNEGEEPDPTLPKNEVAISAQLSAGYYF